MMDGTVIPPKPMPFPKGQPFVANGILYQDDAHVATWVQRVIGEDRPIAQLFCALGVVDPNYTGEQGAVRSAMVPLAAGAIFWAHQIASGWSDLWVAVAATDVAAAHPRVISDILAYPFGVLKVRRLSAEIAASNERAIRQAEKLGFQIEGIKRRNGPNGSDVVLLGLLPDECPFWPPEKTILLNAGEQRKQ